MSERIVTKMNGGQKFDFIGLFCSVGCAIHCAATPVLLSALPSVRVFSLLADPLFHQLVALLCAFLVFRAILPGWRLHRSRPVVQFALGGIGLLFVAAFILPDRCCEFEHVAAAVGQSRPQGGSLSGSPIRLVSTQPHSRVGLSDFGRDLPSHALADRVGPAAQIAAASRWSRSLFNVGDLRATIGFEGTELALAAQPYISPLGGLLLVIAHIVNIRLRCCRRRACVGR